MPHAPAPLYRDPIFDGPTDPTLIWNRQEKAGGSSTHPAVPMCPATMSAGFMVLTWVSLHPAIMVKPGCTEER